MYFNLFDDDELKKNDYYTYYYPSSSYSDQMGNRPRFLDQWDISFRLDELNDAIRRATQEIEFIEKYGESLLGSVSWDEVQNNSI